MARLQSETSPDSSLAQEKSISWRLLLLVFLIALVARAGWGAISIFRLEDPAALEFPDELDYWSLAHSVVEGHGLVGEHGFRALRMPLYPLFLAIFAGQPMGPVFAKAAQWLIGGGAAVLITLLGARVAGRRAGLVAGLLVAVDPFLIFFASLLLTETLFITALCALWLCGWYVSRRGGNSVFGPWLLLGLLSALCVYLRESSLGLIVIWAVFLGVAAGPTRKGWVGVAFSLVIVAASLFPWAIRNQRVTGHMCWLTHRAGISLYDGVGPQATGNSDLGEIKQMAAVRGLDEAAWNRYFFDKSIESIRSDPQRILRLAGVKIARTWNPVPNAEEYQSLWVRLIAAFWTVPIYLLALCGMIRLRKRPAEILALLLPALYVLVVHSVFVGSLRYRLAAMPMLEVLAAVGASAWISPRRGRPDADRKTPQTP